MQQFNYYPASPQDKSIQPDSGIDHSQLYESESVKSHVTGESILCYVSPPSSRRDRPQGMAQSSVSSIQGNNDRSVSLKEPSQLAYIPPNVQVINFAQVDVDNSQLPVDSESDAEVI